MEFPPVYSIVYVLVVHVDMVTNPPLGLYKLPNQKLAVQQEVAIALRTLGTRDQVLRIGELFGIPASTIGKST